MSANVWRDRLIISPSLITFDLCRLAEQVKQLERAGAQMLHIDLLDGYFSPSMPIGIESVRQLRACTGLEFDVHLMAKEQDYFVRELLKIGVQQLVFHVEEEPHIDHRLAMIKASGARAGVALKPASSLSVLDYVLDCCDTVLLMLINPGYANSRGEKQVPYADRKIRMLRQMICQNGSSAKIEIDGRVSPANIDSYGGGVVDIFVAGSTCIDRNNIPESMERLYDRRRKVLEASESNGD